MSNGGRLNSIHALRGLASLWVCWFHLTRGSTYFPTWNPLRATGINGWLGFDIFFVISGFIIPYVLYKSHYDIGNFKHFALKRLIRLEPPYLFSIAFVILLNYASTQSSLYKGVPFSIDMSQIFSNIGHMAALFDLHWLNPVYWTLAIEFQYYLILGIVFPFLMKSRTKSIIIMILFSVAAIYIKKEYLFFKWFFLFFMGFATFIYYSGLSRKTTFLYCLSGGVISSYYTLGLNPALAGFFAVCFILWFKYHNPLLDFFGTISYSLYLIHIPIGGRVINMGSRFAVAEFSQVLVVSLALVISILSAYLLYRFVEKPALEWASSIVYK